MVSRIVGAIAVDHGLQTPEMNVMAGEGYPVETHASFLE